MRVLADTRSLPADTAAAVYEANGADTDFMREWLTTGSTYVQTAWLRDYRDSAEEVMERAFAALTSAELRP
ncbi:hypothetical protein ACWD4V_01210 [Streptomyces tsukubensis]